MCVHRDKMVGGHQEEMATYQLRTEGPWNNQSC